VQFDRRSWPACFLEVCPARPDAKRSVTRSLVRIRTPDPRPRPPQPPERQRLVLLTHRDSSL
jgi:hypothetical protein